MYTLRDEICSEKKRFFFFLAMIHNKRLNNCVFKQKLSVEVDEKETEEKIEEHYKSTNVSKAIEDLEKLRLLLYRL